MDVVCSTLERITFIKCGKVCFEGTLSEINTHHIDFYYVHVYVKGAEMAILEFLNNRLKSYRFMVDIWSIEYRVWEGEQIIYKTKTSCL